ncbi:hypothetical protein GCM10022295_20540 [Streptomyces osmaniensis]|uniref:Uncharacterized protein n=1 Tax=Streptomyces osmaniensis TaxID=593134 RepID=A0ABP6VR61_9ACTN
MPGLGGGVREPRVAEGFRPAAPTRPSPIQERCPFDPGLLLGLPPRPRFGLNGLVLKRRTG